MHILIVADCIIPVVKYGGIERMIWWLGKHLVQQGHEVSYVAQKGSTCPFAKVYELKKDIPFQQQIPSGIDIVHYNGYADGDITTPFVVTEHGNINDTSVKFHPNSIFVSKNHAQRFGATAYVHNGLDLDDYDKPNFSTKRNYVHFLADAAWKVKNVKGAIKIAKQAHEQLAVLGGVRFNFNMGIRITLDTHVKFYGKVGGQQKMQLLNGSKALLFPVLWNEPFGIAITESLYYGCPVVGTPYGSLPELVNKEVGFLSNSYSELSNALKNIQQYNNKHCHDYVVENFSAKKMTDEYIALYEKVLNGEQLNSKSPQLIEAVPKYLEMVE
ncbi:MAG: glycosyltransferase family 4 protein [Chitinophagaceae bacterium]|jgi:glycosyltransferase involved in cell wall biosynthesis|nr:glycosyltransferase family 4 protein [Chitinophagaceae bacterium]